MQVSLFIPCTVDAILVETGQDLVGLMADLGFKLHYNSEQTCCGQPAFTGGHIKEAKKSAKRFIEIFENDEYIISLSGSCVDTVRNDYCRVLADEPAWFERARLLASKVFEFSQFMVDVAGIVDVSAKYTGKVAYHDSCRMLRGLGVKEQPRRMLSAVKGIELVNLNNNEECCGFGGRFSIKYPYISEAIVRDKVNNFVASEAEVLVVSDPGCLLNINSYLQRFYPKRRVEHLVSFLAANREGGN